MARLIPTWILLAPVFVYAAPASEPIDTDDEPLTQRCVTARAISSTDVIGDSAIVFHMISGEFFVNQLPRTCRGLSRDGRFTLDLYGRRVCRDDRIRILKEMGGSLIEGRSCKLGDFRQLTPDEVQHIYSAEPKVPEPEPVDPAEVEEIGDDDEDKSSSYPPTG